MKPAIRSLRRVVPAALLGALAVTACQGMGGYGMASNNAIDMVACPELGGGAATATFEADARANATIRAFVTASGELAAIASRAEAEVTDACLRMGRDLGVPEDQMTPRGGESPAGAACNAVSARMDAILGQGAAASVRVAVTPPQCEVRGDLAASCSAQCTVALDPGYVEAHCAPGHLYGRCDGSCSGRCEGTCNGECSGQCAGQAQAAPGMASGGGRCAGQCNGTCQGSCTADCHGSCSVRFQEPRCDVAVQAPSADANCEGSCRAHADLAARCSEARIAVQASGNAGDLPRLVATLERNLPVLIRAEVAYGQRLAAAVQTLVRAGAELPNALGQVGGRTAACLAAAVNACASAQASLRVSVQASASVSARAGAHAG